MRSQPPIPTKLALHSRLSGEAVAALLRPSTTCTSSCTNWKLLLCQMLLRGLLGNKQRGSPGEPQFLSCQMPDTGTSPAGCSTLSNAFIRMLGRIVGMQPRAFTLCAARGACCFFLSPLIAHGRFCCCCIVRCVTASVRSSCLSLHVS